MDIIKKSQEWAAQYGSLLSASATTRFPTLYKGAVGGLQHVISVDNGAAYMELWRDGTGSYYATTGAAIKQLPGLAKGAALDEALDKFFALTAKLQKARRGGGSPGSFRDCPGCGQRRVDTTKPHVHKGKTYRDRAGVTQPSARKQSPFKKDVTNDPSIGPYGGPKPKATPHERGGAGHMPQVPGRACPGCAPKTPGYAAWKKEVDGPKPVARKARKAYGDVPKGGWSEGTKAWAQAYAHPPKAKPVRKGIVEKVDPEIGPSFSVGHIKPSDLSPESSVSKMAGRIIKAILHHDLDVQTPPSKPKTIQTRAPHPHNRPTGKVVHQHPTRGKGFTGATGSSDVHIRAAKKDIVGLSGGMGKPPRVKPGFGDPARVNKPVGRAPRLITNQDTFGRKTTHRRASYVGSRPAGLGKKLDNIEGGRVSPSGQITPVRPKLGGPGSPVGYGSTGQPQYSYKRAARKARGPVFQPKTPPQTYRSPQGFTGRRMGAPAAPGAAQSGAARTSGRFGKAGVAIAPRRFPTPQDKPPKGGWGTSPRYWPKREQKACSPCREVAKAVRAVRKGEVTSPAHGGPKPHTHGPTSHQHPKIPETKFTIKKQLGVEVAKAVREVNKVVATSSGVQKHTTGQVHSHTGGLHTSPSQKFNYRPSRRSPEHMVGSRELPRAGRPPNKVVATSRGVQKRK